MTKTTTPELNVELAKAVLAQVTEHPETHRQLSWFWDRDPVYRAKLHFGLQPMREGSTACLAGWAFTLAGIKPDVETSGKDQLHVPTEAAKALGLTTEQRLSIFCEFDKKVAVTKLRRLLPA